MNFDQITSELQLIGCSIVKLQINNTSAYIPEGVERQLGLDISEPELFKENQMRYSSLDITVIVRFLQNTDEIFSMKVTAEGMFATPTSVEKAQFIQLVKVNGATALYGILRGKIESITAAVFDDGKITLPFVNIYDYYHNKASKQ
jgi:preprotein translocase subunit SecB